MRHELPQSARMRLLMTIKPEQPVKPDPTPPQPSHPKPDPQPPIPPPPSIDDPVPPGSNPNPIYTPPSEKRRAAAHFAQWMRMTLRDHYFVG
jgi:hypothetical protein